MGNLWDYDTKLYILVRILIGMESTDFPGKEKNKEV